MNILTPYNISNKNIQNLNILFFIVTIKKFNKKITYILSFKLSYNNLEKGYEKIIFLKKYLAKNMNGIEILLQDVYTILNNVLKNLA